MGLTTEGTDDDLLDGDVVVVDDAVAVAKPAGRVESGVVLEGRVGELERDDAVDYKSTMTESIISSLWHIIVWSWDISYFVVSRIHILSSQRSTFAMRQYQAYHCPLVVGATWCNVAKWHQPSTGYSGIATTTVYTEHMSLSKRCRES